MEGLGDKPSTQQQAKKQKKKRKLKAAGAGSMGLAGVGLTEEDQLLSLMDEMSAHIKGTDPIGAGEDVEAEVAASSVSAQPLRKKRKRPRPEAPTDAAAAAAEVMAPSAAAKGSNGEESGDYSSASPHELWRPDVEIEMGSLNLPWWRWGDAAAAVVLAPAPRFQPPEPRAEVARFLAAKQLRALLLSATTTDGLDDDAASSSHKEQVDRVFHRWLRASKVLHDPPPFSSSSATTIDPVLPSHPACQRDLPLAQALLGVGLSAEAAAEACEAVGRESVKAAAALAGGRYDGVVVGAGEEGNTVAPAPPCGKGGKPKRKGGGPSDATGEGGLLLLHPLSRLEQPPVLRSKHHRPCLYLPLSAPALGARLEALERNEAVEVSLLKGRVLRVNGLHYAKLRALYTQHHLTAQQQQQRQQGGSMAMTRAEEALFHERLGCLLFRYQALAAEDQSVTAGVAAIGAWEGLERALPPRVFDVLEQEFGARLECFASPFNCRYARYCSGQWDVDGFFGSLGPFHLFEPLEGAYIAHPPAVPEVVEAAIKHMLRLLARTARPLTFLLVVPGENKKKKKKKKTQDSPSSSSPISSSIGCVRRLLLQASSSCPFLAWTLALAPGEFGLVRGDQHFRPRRLVAEERGEGLLLLSLQSKAARAMGTTQALTPARERALRGAFASFGPENARDSLAPPPSDIVLPASRLQQEGKHEWWW